MGNRILKESYCSSESVDKLTPFEETFFTRLIVNCDDYGRMDGRPKILKAKLYPLKDVTVKQMADCLKKLSSVGMIKLYEIDARPYLQMVSWDKHQQIRSKKSKYPAYDVNLNNPISEDIICNQMISDVPVIQSNPIQSESENEFEYVPEAETAPDSKPVIEMLLNDKSKHPIYQKQIDSWCELYPAVDVIQELRNMVGWLDANPTKRKTNSGINRFVNSWLRGKQDKGGGNYGRREQHDSKLSGNTAGNPASGNVV